MANEFTVKTQITLLNGTLSYKSNPTEFRATQTTKNGPTPGMITVTTGGVTVSLAALTTPGIVRIMNVDTTNYVGFGLYIATVYYPLGELLPGESYVLRLARDMLTANTAAAVLRIKADTASCKVLVEAFDK